MIGVLEQYIDEKKISQTTVADALGVNQSTVSNWLSRRRNINFRCYKQLCDFLSQEGFLNGNE
ncbi:MAG: helix-turn-helix transcriptional regulator [Clostridia bacterium]|nr:helix-turn-helix transcriptional regulator [Clostridia bacterium]